MVQEADSPPAARPTAAVHDAVTVALGTWMVLGVFALILLGRLLEVRAKAGTGEAIRQTCARRPTRCCPRPPRTASAGPC